MTNTSTEETRSRPSSAKLRVRLLFVILGAGMILAGFAWQRKASHKGMPKAKPNLTALAQPVAVQSAVKGDIEIYLESLGTATPFAAVTVRTQITGQLTQVAFAEGQMVARGDILAVIDPRPYLVALEQSKGQLHQAQAQLAEAQIDLSRYDKLSQQDSIAKQTLDGQHALVGQYEGLVQTDQAAVDSAKLNLAYCHITAPISGRVGLRAVDEGNYVTPGDAGGLVVLAQVKPITVIFTLPEENLPRVAARLRAHATIPVDVYDQAQTHKLASGALVAIDNQVDPTTGTFRLRAKFTNDDESLYPLQFVNVRMLLDVDRQATVIPTSAIERNQNGAFVYVIKPGNIASARPVTLGATEGERVAVSGVSVGERVVVDGADRLREGMPVAIQAPDSRP